jgi:mitochondrial protein import protein ZIM17
VNPHAFEKGTIFVQCKGCEAWHQLVDNPGLIQEYDFRDIESDSKE